jgi:hypothetical protein
MMKKFFKIATMCSLVLSLPAVNSAYASNPSSTNDITTNNTSVALVKGDVKRSTEELYAVDIHHDSKLTFHYQAINDYNPDTLRYSYGVSERGKGLIGADAADTAAKVSTAARNYTDPVPNVESDTFDGQLNDSDTNPQGAWYGFDGVTNRIVVINRSINDVRMTATSSREGVQLDETYNSTATINLYLNGDDIADITNEEDPPAVITPAYKQRTLDLTGGKTLKRSGEEDFVSGELYQIDTASPNYTENFKNLLTYPQAFSTKANDTTGGRFSANPEEEVGSGDTLTVGNIDKSEYSAVIQASDDQADPPVVANNFVNIAGHSTDSQTGDHLVGYALVYFDITGRPFDIDDPTVYQAQHLVNADGTTALDSNIPVSTKIGTITLSFSKSIS